MPYYEYHLRCPRCKGTDWATGDKQKFYRCTRCAKKLPRLVGADAREYDTANPGVLVLAKVHEGDDPPPYKPAPGMCRILVTAPLAETRDGRLLSLHIINRRTTIRPKES